MNINPEYLEGLLAFEKQKMVYQANGMPPTVIKFIEAAKDIAGVEITCRYILKTSEGTKTDIAGFLFEMPDRGKGMFIQDIAIDKADVDVAFQKEGIEWFVESIKKFLESIKDN